MSLPMLEAILKSSRRSALRVCSCNYRQLRKNGCAIGLTTIFTRFNNENDLSATEILHPLLCAAVAFNDFNSRLQLQQSRSITSAVLQQAYLKGHLMAVYLAMTAWRLEALPPMRTECCL